MSQLPAERPSAQHATPWPVRMKMPIALSILCVVCAFGVLLWSLMRADTANNVESHSCGTHLIALHALIMHYSGDPPMLPYEAGVPGNEMLSRSVCKGKDVDEARNHIVHILRELNVRGELSFVEYASDI